MKCILPPLPRGDTHEGPSMTLLSPIWLFLLVPLALALWVWRPPTRLPARRAPARRCCSSCVSLAGLALRLPSKAGTVVVVVDRSLSMPAGSDETQKEAIDLIIKEMGGDDRVAVVSFGAAGRRRAAAGGRAVRRVRPPGRRQRLEPRRGRRDGPGAHPARHAGPHPRPVRRQVDRPRPGAVRRDGAGPRHRHRLPRPRAARGGRPGHRPDRRPGRRSPSASRTCSPPGCRPPSRARSTSS